MKEVWKKIKGYDNYLVSNLGKVYSYNKNKILNPYIIWSGYKCIKLCKGGIKKTHTIHKLVATEFVKNKKRYKYIRFKNHDKLNCYYKNLEWCVFPTQDLIFNGTPIVQYDLNRNKIQKFVSMQQAEKITTISLAQIYRCVVGQRKTTRGFIFKKLR